MLRVVYDYQVFAWQRFGGVSRYICEVAGYLFDQRELHQLDIKILALAYVNEYLKDLPPELVTGMFVPKLKRTGSVIKILDQVMSTIWLTANQPDIIHRTFYSEQEVKPRNSKVVITIYDMIDEKFSPFSDICRRKKQAIEEADHLICISQHTQKDLIELLDIDPQKTSVIYLGHSLSKKADRSSQHQPKIDPYILYVGERGGYKNFVGFLKAYSSSQKLKDNFSVVCFGGGKLAQSDYDLATTLGIPGEKLKYVSGDDSALIEYYRGAAVFVYPSLYEGFGIPILEAMSLGCPVVCSNTSSLAEVAGNAAAFFDPQNPESIALALEKVLFSEAESYNLVQLGLLRAKEFSWEKCAEETLKVYRSLT